MTYEPRPEDTRIVPPENDPGIIAALEKLSLEQLSELSYVSGTTDNSGYLMAHREDATREDYIEELSDTSDKADWQLAVIRKKLSLESQTDQGASNGTS